MFDSGQIGAPSRKVPRRNAATLAWTASRSSGGDAVDLRQGHDAVPHAQQGEDIEVFAGLRHDAVVSGHHQDDAVHAAGPGDHRLDEVLMPRHVDDADLGIADLAGREPQFDRHPPLFLLLEPIGFAAGEAFHQRRLAVVDVSGSAKGDVDLLQSGISW